MAEKRKSLIPKTKARVRVFNARRDTLDFRDRMYEPTLVEVPTARDLKEYRKVKAPILDQGREGACTGYGLATVVNYLLRTRHRVPCTTDVSPRMLLEDTRAATDIGSAVINRHSNRENLNDQKYRAPF